MNRGRKVILGWKTKKNSQGRHFFSRLFFSRTCFVPFCSLHVSHGKQNENGEEMLFDCLRPTRYAERGAEGQSSKQDGSQQCFFPHFLELSQCVASHQEFFFVQELEPFPGWTPRLTRTHRQHEGWCASSTGGAPAPLVQTV